MAKDTTTTELVALANAKERIKLRCHVSSICETTVAPIRALTVKHIDNVPQTRKGQHTLYGAQNKKLPLADNIPQLPRAKGYLSVVDGIIQVNATLVKSAGTKIRTLTCIDPGGDHKTVKPLGKGKGKGDRARSRQLSKSKDGRKGKAGK